MDVSEANRIVAMDTTVANKIRALDAAGFPRREIARLLNKRPQHVRNVLEDDKLYGRRPRTPLPAAEAAAPGVAEASRAFAGVVRLTVGSDGSVRLPPEMLSALGARPGGVLIAELDEDRATLLGPRAAMAKVDAIMAPFRWTGGPLASDELIAERRAEGAREFHD
jgi:antidote-toxin recognition MazE-like antitoxin